MTYERIYRATALMLILFLTVSCMKYGPAETEDFHLGPSGEGLFIVNEGNFMYGNASLSYYIPGSGNMHNEVFVRANGINLGDVAQSMTIYKGKGYIVVNNSGIIFVIDPDTFRLKGSITGMISPRYIHFINDHKAYVTDLYQEKITIVDPVSFQITGYVPTPGHRSTEEMAQWKNLLFVSCWSYDNMLLVIDTRTDRIVDSLVVEKQPTQLLLDGNDKIWCAASGNMYRIDPGKREIEQAFLAGDLQSRTYLALNPGKDTLYFLNRNLWRMSVNAESLPAVPFVRLSQRPYYGLAVDPTTCEIYVSDALDYVQQGKIYRFNPQGVPVDTLTAGINPGFFCFK